MTALGWPDRSHSGQDLGRFLIRMRDAAVRVLGSVASPGALAHATWIVTLSGTIILTLLSMRVWFQLMGETEGGAKGFIYDLSGIFASPFRKFEPTTPIKENGILEFSSLVAIEAYLIGMLVTLTVLFSARLALIAAPKVVHRRRPAVATEQTRVVAVPETPQA
jgi:hypothetical protein